METEGYNVKIADDQLDPSKDFDDFLDKYSSLSKSNIIFIRLSQPTLNNDFEFANDSIAIAFQAYITSYLLSAFSKK